MEQEASSPLPSWVGLLERRYIKNRSSGKLISVICRITVFATFVALVSRRKFLSIPGGTISTRCFVFRRGVLRWPRAPRACDACCFALILRPGQNSSTLERCTVHVVLQSDLRTNISCKLKIICYCETLEIHLLCNVNWTMSSSHAFRCFTFCYCANWSYIPFDACTKCECVRSLISYNCSWNGFQARSWQATFAHRLI